MTPVVRKRELHKTDNEGDMAKSAWWNLTCNAVTAGIFKIVKINSKRF
jgi:hypothetical protein